MIKVIVGILSAYLMVFAMAFPSGALLDDFDDGDFDGWEVQAEAWEIENKEIKFPGGGNCGASLYYKDGADWMDYEFEVDVKLANHSDYPGGIRVRLDSNSGESYFTWIYPGQNVIISYVATAWDCNANKGKAAEDEWEPPKVGDWGKLKMVVKGDVIESWWDGEKILSFEDSSLKKGTIALMTYNQEVYFDNARVSGKDIPLSPSEAVHPGGKMTTTWGWIKGASE